MQENPQKSENIEVLIIQGEKIGRLEIGPLVYNVRNHPEFVMTKSSYLRQGRIRECTCLCGTIKLISEAALRTGRIKSCGCLRKEIKLKSWRQFHELQMHKEKRQALTAEIKSLQAELGVLLIQNPKDEDLIWDITYKIRELMGQKLSYIDYRRNKNVRDRRKAAKQAKLAEQAQARVSSAHGQAPEQTAPR